MKTALTLMMLLLAFSFFFTDGSSWAWKTFPTTYINGFTVVHPPAFTGSVLHPATLFSTAGSVWMTVPTPPAVTGFRTVWVW